ncbi:uncharacterized protein ACR2FA_011045 [Aphomia sociella]
MKRVMRVCAINILRLFFSIINTRDNGIKSTYNWLSSSFFNIEDYYKIKMAAKSICCFLIIILTVKVQAQFFDLFSEFHPQPYYQTTKSTIHQYQEEHTTKRIKTINRNEGTNTQTKRRHNTRTTTVSSNHEGTERDSNRQIAKDKPKRRLTTSAPLFNLNFQTTQKPHKRTTKASKNDNTSASFRDDFRNLDLWNANVGGRRTGWPDSSANIITEHYTSAPNFGSARNRYNQNQFTTYNPLYNVPGVRPAVVDSNKPPITNRPATQRPYAVFPRPTDSGVIRFPQGPDTSPPVLTSPDEDDMSSVEKRRYIEVSERMCDKYKSRSVTKLQAIPLLPSPDPVQTNVTRCAPPLPLVVGGKVVSIREFPHMALLGWIRVQNGDYSWKCGGSLLSDKFVLTAAHCAFQDKDNTVVPGAPRVVQLGSSYLDDSGALVVKVASVYRHAKYTQARSYFDTALIKLARVVTFSEVIQPACLGIPPSVGEPVIATGWGRTEFGGDQSLELRSVSIPVWDMDDCRRILGISRKLPEGPSPESQICAGERNGGKDTCQGDSGGPAQVRDGCVWRVVAITSVGRSCGAAQTPALYAKINRASIAAVVFSDQAKQQTGKRQDNNYDNYENNNNKGHNQESNYNNNNNGRRQEDNYNRNSPQSNYDSNNRNNNDGQNYYNNYNRRQQYSYIKNDNKQQGTNYDRNNQQNYNGNKYFGNYDTGGDEYRQSNNDNYRVNDFSRPTTHRNVNYDNNDSRHNSRNNNYRIDYNNDREKEKYIVSDDVPGNEDIIYWPDS